MATARQLNDTGVTESIAIGDAFETLGIQVGRVLSSEFCRNFRTAELMDFGPELELVQGISFFVYDDVGDRCDSTKQVIGEVPAPGSNTAVIGHAGFSCQVTADPASNVGALQWAEAAIFKPDGSGGAEFITRLLWNEWAG